jgi:hypothetical protein
MAASVCFKMGYALTEQCGNRAGPTEIEDSTPDCRLGKLNSFTIKTSDVLQKTVSKKLFEGIIAPG